LFENTGFSYDGIDSSNFGIYLVNLSTGSRNVPVGVSRSIIEDKIPTKAEPYFYHLEYEPLRFLVTLVRTAEWTKANRLDIVEWLFQTSYKPFISDDDEDIIYNCIAVDSPQKILVGNIQRMIELTFQCDAPWAWTDFEEEYYDLTTNPTSTVIEMENLSNIVEWYEPEIEIIKRNGAGTITLTNAADGNKILELEDLLNNEEIYINNRLKQISSNEPDRYPLNHFNRNWLRLAKGENDITVVGECEINTRMKYPIGI